MLASLYTFGGDYMAIHIQYSGGCEWLGLCLHLIARYGILWASIHAHGSKQFTLGNVCEMLKQVSSALIICHFCLFDPVRLPFGTPNADTWLEMRPVPAICLPAMLACCVVCV